MKNIKSHFWYSKNQRNGIFFLALLIIILQLIYWFVNFSSDELVDLETTEVLAFQAQIDSLKLIEIEKRKPKKYLFNPSFITDYKGYKLGMSVAEIDRLLAYRKQGKYINSAKQFQQVTKISDSLLAVIKPLFKFPDWLHKSKNTFSNTTNIVSKDLNLVTVADLQLINGIGKVLSKRIVKFRNSIGGFSTNEQLKKVYGLDQEVVAKILKHYKVEEKSVTTNNKTVFKIKDLNKAKAEDLTIINGIGAKLSKRIVKFRNSIGGFLDKDQLSDVYGLDKEVIQKLFEQFSILSKPKINKININEATFKQILHLPYIDYELTKKIVEYKSEFAEFQSLEELKKIDGFPIDKYDRIVLYLTTEY